mmetsp:Transcript_18747/g.22447  ORF Transcript_18747/g.22447 Transcript_18747/m.22447 type:complete len:114 (-) Transcript_18747:75-416(-)|eukprot:CAMPEP_0197856928 /NCGR_PEP_ID=MMETSP1438-20131217/29496_1 /TAXON_ID=1461541 /ORGANISM="Pterosperma sp., Strain CCMP1384" /LENGTH=113 /DNA_ID=CAMNT_0043472569 /DNA_START=351 /DNA_END=692 /DNA_ORIENTATION=+
MGGKAKQQKHTAKEINAKLHANKMDQGGAGGGAQGLKARQTLGKVMLTCAVCGQPNFNAVDDVRAHYESKHSKLPFDAEFYKAKQAEAKSQTGSEQAKVKELKAGIKKNTKKT